MRKGKEMEYTYIFRRGGGNLPETELTGKSGTAEEALHTAFACISPDSGICGRYAGAPQFADTEKDLAEADAGTFSGICVTAVCGGKYAVFTAVPDGADPEKCFPHGAAFNRGKGTPDYLFLSGRDCRTLAEYIIGNMGKEDGFGFAAFFGNRCSAAAESGTLRPVMHEYTGTPFAGTEFVPYGGEAGDACGLAGCAASGKITLRKPLSVQGAFCISERGTECTAGYFPEKCGRQMMKFPRF